MQSAWLTSRAAPAQTRLAARIRRQAAPATAAPQAASTSLPPLPGEQSSAGLPGASAWLSPPKRSNDWLANFLLIEVFPVWQNAISLAGVMMCFAGLALGAAGFVYWFLPETKGHSVEEIIQLFERDARSSSTVSGAGAT